MPTLTIHRAAHGNPLQWERSPTQSWIWTYPKRLSQPHALSDDFHFHLSSWLSLTRVTVRVSHILLLILRLKLHVQISWLLIISWLSFAPLSFWSRRCPKYSPIYRASESVYQNHSSPKFTAIFYSSILTFDWSCHSFAISSWWGLVYLTWTSVYFWWARHKVFPIVASDLQLFFGAFRLNLDSIIWFVTLLKVLMSIYFRGQLEAYSFSNL